MRQDSSSKRWCPVLVVDRSLKHREILNQLEVFICEAYARVRMDFICPSIVALFSQLLLFLAIEEKLKQREDKAKIVKSIC